jgi:subtilisin-like proprotein convertase family protein
MKKLLFIALNLFGIVAISQTIEDAKKITATYDLNKIKVLADDLQKKSINEKNRAWEIAKSKGWATVIETPNGGLEELIRIDENGLPVYFATDNAAAARSTRASFLNTGGGMGLSLNGQNMFAGVWDGGRVRATHNLLNGRVTTPDDNTSTSFTTHGTHVTGTIIASNAVAATKGMAYQATARTYNWSSDQAEVLSEIQNGILISNHSYGVPLVSSTGVRVPAWQVGAYTDTARAWDEIMYLAPYYLAVTSAGNSGLENNTNPSTFGFDKLIGNKLSKNILTVANAEDAVIDSNGNLSGDLLINSSSSQGPADDNRIKPDITGNGTSVLSTSGASNSATATLTGTSMASPNVAGTLLLVQQHSKNITGNFLRASTLKGIATHTADEAGNLGPDAVFGWGLLNGKKCVEAINENGLKSWIAEETLNQGQTFTLKVNASGLTPLIASITWTDVPGIANTNSGIINNPAVSLVNDLDIRITRGVNIFFPWRLTSDPNSEALRDGDNNVDNVENVTIDNPTVGEYTITITHKGTLADGPQKFSLVVTGLNSTFGLVPTTDDLIVCSTQSAVFNFNYKQNGTGTTNFTATGLPAGATAIFSSNSMNSNGTVSMTISNLSNVTPGNYIVGITGNNGIETETRLRNLRVYNGTLLPIQTTNPFNNQNDVPLLANIKWNADPNAESYRVEIATDLAFTNIVNTMIDITSTNAISNPLNQNTIYFYRVIPKNRCGNGSVAAAQIKRFATGIQQCNNNFIATDFSNATIATTALGLATIPINVNNNFKIGDVNVNLKINHTYVQDMTISLIGPPSIGSPEVFLTKETCAGVDNIDAKFDDEGLFVNCNDVPPAISGDTQPYGRLSDFNELMSAGVWTIKVVDPYDGDGGTVISASLSFCRLNASPLSNNSFSTNQLQMFPNPTTGILNINLVDVSGETNFRLIDVSGRVVLDKSTTEVNNIFDLSNFQNGIYLLNIKNAEKETTKKIILNK